MVEAFPLQWPIGYPRAAERFNSNFSKTTPDKTRKELLAEIGRLSGDREPVISSNVPLRKDGHMYADVANDELKDPGVAVYFLYNDRPVALACDNCKTPVENIRALSLTIEAIRGMERWKCTQILERTFTGFPALPEVTSAETDIWLVLGLSAKPADIDIVKNAYKSKLLIVHPDKPTGNRHAFDQLQDAYKKALSFYPIHPP